jgi:diketogulonate reductase-like aldo/keto reductase
MDLMQVNNLVDWRAHLETLKTWKAQGRVRNIGITTSHGRRNDDVEAILKAEAAVEFAQFT